MATGIRKDLRKRLEEAHANGICLTPESASDARRLRAALKRRDVISPAPQVYALPELWATLKPTQHERQRVRALAKLHPNWVFANVSAAVLHGLSVSYGLLGRVHLACTRNTHARNTEHYIRHIITTDEPIVVDGVRTTSLQRTVFDCTRQYAFPDALAIADSALRISNEPNEAFVSAFANMHNNCRNKWRAIDTMALADVRAESGGESIARAAMISHGYSLPDLQREIPHPVDARKYFRVDFYWNLSTGPVAGEIDGREKYVDPVMTGGRSVVDVLADERVREALITSGRCQVMRLSYKDVRNSRTFCAIMDVYGIPKGQPIPAVARLLGPARY